MNGKGPLSDVKRKKPAFTPDQLPAAVAALHSAARSGAQDLASEIDIDQLAASAREVSGAKLLVADVGAVPAKALMDVADRVKGQLGDHAFLPPDAEARGVQQAHQTAEARHVQRVGQV